MHIVARLVARIHMMLQGKIRSYPMVRRSLEGKAGLEIGGPSAVFKRWYGPLPVYSAVGSLDNCVFSDKTVWASLPSEYIFDSRKKPGKTIICDGTELSVIPDGCYDFILSSHNLEHFANPVKALKEWERVVRPGGALVLVLPYYASTFDHRRSPTEVSHMLEDFEKNTQEDDLTHLPEILQLHELDMDSPAGTIENFRDRSLDNFANRCLHHHVFDEHNSRELLEGLGMNVLSVELAPPVDLFIFARFRSETL